MFVQTSGHPLQAQSCNPISFVTIERLTPTFISKGYLCHLRAFAGVRDLHVTRLTTVYTGPQ
jgi:hypothetical protein